MRILTQSYNIWNKWGKLKTVMLGQCYPPSFFDGIKNNRIRDALLRITEETMADLENYERILKDFGCQVLRPELDSNLSIMDYIDNNGIILGIPRSPLQPRDSQLVAGNKLFHVNLDHPSIRKRLDEYDPLKTSSMFFDVYSNPAICPRMERKIFEAVAGPDWLTYEDYLQEDYFSRILPHIKDEILSKGLYTIGAPSITVVGKDMYVDVHGLVSNNVHLPKLVSDEINEKFRMNYLTIGGHNDGVFHTLKPGAILSLHNIQRYEDTFPGWDICYLNNQSWSLVGDFLSIKNKNGGKWWVPGEEDNDEFTEFVETWLQDWVGYVEESVFDVNVLVLDERHVCINNMNPIVIDFLKKHKMEPVHVPWRHRYFWDGGLHCITLDLYREGGQEDYFPDRKSPIVDLGFPD